MEEEARHLVTYNLPLTSGDPTKVVLILPENLTGEEAARISQFIHALADAYQAPYE